MLVFHLVLQVLQALGSKSGDAGTGLSRGQSHSKPLQIGVSFQVFTPGPRFEVDSQGSCGDRAEVDFVSAVQSRTKYQNKSNPY